MTGAASVRTQFVESRAIGDSNFTAPRLAGALATSARLGLPRYERLQPLGRAAYEAELEPLCRAQGLGVINFFGLARGFLTGKYRSAADLGKSATRRRHPGLPDTAWPRGAGRAGRRRASPQQHTGPGGTGLADQPARPDRAHLQRHQHGAVGRAGGCGAAALAGCHAGGVGCCQR